MDKAHSEILSYAEMCSLVGGTIQKGINVRYRGKETVLLMSQRKNAPYPDRYDPARNVLEYVGHDAHTTDVTPNPKNVDQPLLNEKGTRSDNAKLVDFVKQYKSGGPVEVVHIFEKIQPSIWSDKGRFKLVDYREDNDGKRKIFVFSLEPVPAGKQELLSDSFEQTRLIPTEVKVAVFKRDKGHCVLCGSAENLHYDHDFPFSKGGTSLLAQNIRILCAKCNLKKGAKIQ